MISDDFLDGFLSTGYLPNEHAVTATAPGGTAVPLRARREEATEEMMAAAGVEMGTEACVFFFWVNQTGWVRPRNRWKIADSGGDGSVWIVQKDLQTHQQRGIACVCTRETE